MSDLDTSTVGGVHEIDEVAYRTDAVQQFTDMNIMDAMSGSSERVGGRILSESNDIISLVDHRPRKRQAP